MKRYPVADMKNIHILGRTTRSEEGLNLFWTGSGIEVNAAGTELYVELTAGFDWFEPWIEILIDGAFSQRRMLEKGRQRICVFRAVERGAVRNVQILKATQAAGGDPASFLQINALVSDGVFLPVEPCAMKLEVIGDSLTSGEGLSGSLLETTWNASLFSACTAYPYLLARMLRADLHVISQSGFGVYCSWRGETRESLPQYYRQVCGPLSGAENEAKGALQPWDFASWQPDFIVVSLGTNDSGSFDHGGTYFPEVDWTCPMRLNPDGTIKEADRERISGAAVQFLRDLRACNPGSYLIWCYGMLRGRLTEILRDAVNTYRQETGDGRVTFVLLPETQENEIGARLHPGAIAHRKVAEALFGVISGLK